MADQPTFNIIKHEKQITTREELVIETYKKIMEADTTGLYSVMQNSRINFITAAAPDIPISTYDIMEIFNMRPSRDKVKKEVLSDLNFIYEEAAVFYDPRIDLEIEKQYLINLQKQTANVLRVLKEHTNWAFFKEIKGAEIR